MASPGQEGPTLDQSVQGLDLNAALGLLSYSGDELCKANDPQTLQETCSFVGRVVKYAAENKITEVKAVQQILIKAARNDLCQKGVVEFECSDSETRQRRGNAATMRNLGLML